MGLREIAEADLAITAEDADTGFGFPITVTDPLGAVAVLTGLSGDIASLIHPDTGVAVSGRQASIALRIKSIVDSVLTGLPENIPESTKKPWLVAFNDINGNPFTFKVSSSNPDRTLGLVTCLLELYET